MDELTFSMLYAYSEDFVLVFSHDEVVHGKGSMAGKMPGETLEAKYSNLRAAYGYMMTPQARSYCLWDRISGRCPSGTRMRVCRGIC